MGNGFGMVATLGMGHRQHVEGVIVIGIFVPHQVEVRDGLVVPPAIDGEGRRVQAFVDGLRRRLTGRDMPLADVQVEADALLELFFVGILAQD